MLATSGQLAQVRRQALEIDVRLSFENLKNVPHLRFRRLGMSGRSPLEPSDQDIAHVPNGQVPCHREALQACIAKRSAAARSSYRDSTACITVASAMNRDIGRLANGRNP